MAGMFYSLEEVIQRLNKTEEEIKQLVREGKLREFRDGPSLLFKVDEVEALTSDTSVMRAQEPPAETETDKDETLAFDTSAIGAQEPPAEPETDKEEILAFDTSAMEAQEPPAEPETDEEEILLVPEPTQEQPEPEELTEADTISADEQTNIMSETDSEYLLAEDTKGETAGPSEETTSSGETIATEGTKAASEEASLQEIEDDVNLDTFGSGSGLLDLSLQADDTSLGGILDEIYTAEGKEEQAGTGTGYPMDVAAESEQILTQSPEGAAMARAYALEPEPDKISNAFGIVLLLPLLAVLYTAIVAVAGFNGVMPLILHKVQDMIWYIVGGVAVLAVLIIAIPLMLSGSSGKTAKKPKAKKVKKQKGKKGKKDTPVPTSEAESV